MNIVFHVARKEYQMKTNFIQVYQRDHNRSPYYARFINTNEITSIRSIDRFDGEVAITEEGATHPGIFVSRIEVKFYSDFYRRDRCFFSMIEAVDLVLMLEDDTIEQQYADQLFKEEVKV